ncbi:MAG: tripartite tricarboxylate transporter substrate binding protein, partial [Synergistaceae bacterium]|nr:tripartite tricarboxylate transporter substrate binding protein [Synergistaceae bacterium]
MKKVFASALVIVMVLSGVSFAADWPSGTVNVILPYGAGGDTDTYCRQLFQRVSKVTGQTFVVINEQGGSGIVAAMDVLNKKPDGYTLLFNHT